MADQCFPSIKELREFGIDAETWSKFINGEIDEENLNREGVDVETLLTWRARVIEIATQAANMQTYLTKADADAAQPQPEGTVAQVTNDPDPDNNGYWVSDGTTLLRSGIQPASAEDVRSLQEAIDQINVPDGFVKADAEGYINPSMLNNNAEGALNLFNFKTAHQGMALAPGGVLVEDDLFYTSDYMLVAPGTYHFSVAEGQSRFVSVYSLSTKTHVQTSGYAGEFVLSGGFWRYVRISQRYTDTPPESHMFVPGELPEAYVPFKDNEIVFKVAENKAGGYAGLDDGGQLNANLIRTFAPSDAKNVFDMDAADIDVSLDSDDGTLISDPGYFTSDFIPCESGDTFTWNYKANQSNLFVGYDENFEFVNSASFSGSYTVGNGQFKYLKFSSRNDIVPIEEFVMTKNEPLPAVYTPHENSQVESPRNKNVPGGYAGLDDDGKIPGQLLPSIIGGYWSGKKLVALGDSITYGFIPRNDSGYPGRLTPWGNLTAESLGMSEFVNYGISGSTLGAPSNGSRSPMTRRYDDMDDDADLIIVMGGTNDFRWGPSEDVGIVPLGQFSDSMDTTYYGALHVLCQGLIDKYMVQQGLEAGRQKQILFMTPIKNIPNMGGDLNPYLRPYCEAMLEVCAHYSVPCLDLYNVSGINPHILQTVQGTESGYTGLYNPYIPDGTHPNQDGHRLMSSVIAGFLIGLRA